MSAVAEPWAARPAGPSPAGGSAAATHGVSKVFGVTPVLKDVSVDVPVGDARALVGRNGAGKSTLVALLTGLLSPSSGTVELAGRPAPPLGDRRAWRERVACVYQRWTVIPGLTVAENLFLNNQETVGGLIRWRRVRERARAVLRDWDLDVDPDLEASRLTVEQRQVVEIGRALLQGSRFIILDEPTAELERREVNRLFDRIKALQESGVTFVYISHHLEEIYEICRTVSVLRDGVLVANAPLADMPKDRLVTAMVGEAATGVRPGPRAAAAGAASSTPALAVDGLRIGEAVRDVSFAVARGECVGLAGLAGSGKDEIGEVIAGLRRATGGTVHIEGVPLDGRSPVEARRRGVGFVPRDRHVRGNFPLLPIAENLTVTVTDSLGALGFAWPSRRRERAGRLMDDLGIVASSVDQPVGELSGGNQQKGLMGRAFASAPKVLVLVAPTQGVDIASKTALFGVVAEARARGTAVLVISDELDELSICDRVLVVFRGRLVAFFGRARDDHALVAAIEGLAGEPNRG